jgi:hypothetical protein
MSRQLRVAHSVLRGPRAKWGSGSHGSSGSDHCGLRSDFPDFNDPNKLGEGSAKVERLSNLIAIFQKPEQGTKYMRIPDATDPRLRQRLVDLFPRAQTLQLLS